MLPDSLLHSLIQEQSLSGSPVNIDVNDLISITITLLILSFITEKITDFLKLHFPSLYVKSNDEIEEKKRDRGIMLLGFGMGFFVAFASQVHVFHLLDLKLGPDWLPEWLWHLLGYMLTAVFLSFGSKFFHDLLDLLLQVKNLQRKINDERTYKVDSVKELMEHLEFTPGMLTKRALEQNEERLFAIENVVAAGIGINASGEKCIDVHISDHRKELIPPLFVTLPSGGVQKVLMNVIEGGEIVAHLDVKPTSLIRHSGEANQFGAFGCVVYKKDLLQELMLTCYHVVRSKHMHKEVFTTSFEKSVSILNENANQIGYLMEGVIDSEIDAALVLPIKDVSIDLDPPKLSKATQTRLVDEKEENVTEVQMFSAKAKELKKGLISNARISAVINYGPDIGKRKLHNLISVSPKGKGPFSVPGDSGSLVVDKNGVALGILVAGPILSPDSKGASYIIPFPRILERLKLTLTTPITN